MAVFWKTGMYRGRWSVAGIDDLFRAFGAVVGVTVLATVACAVWSPADLPTSAILIYGFVSLPLVAGSRASYVLLMNTHRRLSAGGSPVLIYGAGRSGAAAVEELLDNPGTRLRPVGFIDDAPANYGKLVSGLPVLGGVGELARILPATRARAIVIATPSIAPERLEAATRTCERLGVGLFRMHVELDTVVKDPRIRIQAAPARVQEPAPPARSHAPAVPARAAVFGLPVLSVQACASCGASSVHRSHSRNLYERIRSAHSSLRLYRCRACGWRGWLVPLEIRTSVQAPLEVGDLSRLDAVLEAAAPASRPATLKSRDFA